MPFLIQSILRASRRRCFPYIVLTLKNSKKSTHNVPNYKIVSHRVKSFWSRIISQGKICNSLWKTTRVIYGFRKSRMSRNVSADCAWSAWVILPQTHSCATTVPNVTECMFKNCGANCISSALVKLMHNTFMCHHSYIHVKGQAQACSP